MDINVIVTHRIDPQTVTLLERLFDGGVTSVPPSVIPAVTEDLGTEEEVKPAAEATPPVVEEAPKRKRRTREEIEKATTPVTQEMIAESLKSQEAVPDLGEVTAIEALNEIQEDDDPLSDGPEQAPVLDFNKDIWPLATKLAQDNKGDSLKAILSEYGTTKVSKVPVEKYNEFYAKLKAIA